MFAFGLQEPSRRWSPLGSPSLVAHDPGRGLKHTAVGIVTVLVLQSNALPLSYTSHGAGLHCWPSDPSLSLLSSASYWGESPCRVLSPGFLISCLLAAFCP